MQSEQQPVLQLAEPQQMRAKERRSFQVEGPQRCFMRPSSCLGHALARGQRAQLLHLDREFELRRDHLHRRPVLRLEGRAERLVPSDDLAQRALQRGAVQRSLEPEHDRHVVYRPARQQPVQHPQLLLRER